MSRAKPIHPATGQTPPHYGLRSKLTLPTVHFPIAFLSLAWGLDILCRDAKYYSPTITAVLLPEGHDAEAFRGLALETFNISYGASFGPYAKKYFRIGHLGDVNDTWQLGALAATEMALGLAGIPHKKGGAQAAMDYIVSAHAGGARVAAE